MIRVLFVDVRCPRPYDGNTLLREPQGGTESTVTRLAEALAAGEYRVRVTQHNRAERETVNGVEHTPLKDNGDYAPTHVVALNDSTVLDAALERWPAARGIAWYHNPPEAGPDFSVQAHALVRNRAPAVLLSDWQRQQWDALAHCQGFGGRLALERIYNPIPDDLVPDATPVDPEKLVFFCSPHKGLKETLGLFARFQDFAELKDMRLYLANPGYCHIYLKAPMANVVNLGSLTWKAVIREVRSAFAVLHYNRLIPDAFGLVHAEANAVGTPWLSGRLGANPEVCDHPDQLVDLDRPATFIERMIRWRRHGRIGVRARPAFRMASVGAEWRRLLEAHA